MRLTVMLQMARMRWTPKGAHLLLQVRPNVLNDELGGAFRRWYPAFVAHCARPTVGTLATARPSTQVRQGVPLGEVQQPLGHARIDTTTIYPKLATRDHLAVHASIEW